VARMVVRVRALERVTALDAHARAQSVWYRVTGLASRSARDLGVSIIEAEIRHAQYEVLLEAAKLVLAGEPVEIARELRARAERIIRPTT
jgi:hypothetical protein